MKLFYITILKAAIIAASFFYAGIMKAGSGLIISEFLANPAGSDSPFEFVELQATKFIDFSQTPYCVIFSNNGSATLSGWIAGAGLTYGFNINSGTVNTGDVVYVGGSAMVPTGVKLKIINTGTTQGDGFGDFSSSGVLGNGGSNADGIAVFEMDIAAVSSSSVPVDAIFFGAGTGTAVVSAGADGYQLPVNDRYAGGKLQANSFLAPDPGSGKNVIASGTYDTIAHLFSIPRTWVLDSNITSGASLVTLSGLLISGVKPQGESSPEIMVYPNPFCEESTLRLTLEYETAVSVELYNLSGKKIKTIAEGNFSQGTAVFKFNTHQENLPGGIYFLKTDIQDKSTVIKIVKQ